MLTTGTLKEASGYTFNKGSIELPVERSEDAIICRY